MIRLPIWPVRRFVQAIVIVSLFAIPLVARYAHYLSARELDRVTERWEGSVQGTLLETTDRIVSARLPNEEKGVVGRRPRHAILDRVQSVQGSVWSMRLGPVSLTDLLAGAESIACTGSVLGVLLVGLFLPLLITILFGRVYCGWICPMRPLFDLALKFRTVLRFLEITPGNARLGRGNKYALLGAGLVIGAVLGIPLLHYVYPPALLSREAHLAVSTLFDRAESGTLGFALAGLTGGALFLVSLLLIEAAVAPGLWCQSLCPGGALYSAFGWFRILRVERETPACTQCTLCDKVCPMGQLPMIDRIDVECDSCGVCVDVCEPAALSYKWSYKWTGPFEKRPVATGKSDPSTIADIAMNSIQNGKADHGTKVVAAIIALVLSSCVAPRVDAHHIMGIPHYDYDESYPQAPVLRLVERLGDWEVQMTGYPGHPIPGQRTELHVYVQDVRDQTLYDQELTLWVESKGLLGNASAHGPETSRVSENLFKFYPTYPADGNYEVVLQFAAEEGVRSTLRFPLVVGEPGSPVWTLGLYVSGLLFFIIIIRAIRIKRDRRKGRR